MIDSTRVNLNLDERPTLTILMVLLIYGGYGGIRTGKLQQIDVPGIDKVARIRTAGKDTLWPSRPPPGNFDPRLVDDVHRGYTGIGRGPKIHLLLGLVFAFCLLILKVFVPHRTRRFATFALLFSATESC